MFWVHGGAFVYGSNSNELYGPEYIITEDVVIVAINYRLGILGKQFRYVVVSFVINFSF